MPTSNPHLRGKPPCPACGLRAVLDDRLLFVPPGQALCKYCLHLADTGSKCCQYCSSRPWNYQMTQEAEPPVWVCADCAVRADPRATDLSPRRGLTTPIITPDAIIFRFTVWPLQNSPAPEEGCPCASPRCTWAGSFFCLKGF